MPLTPVAAISTGVSNPSHRPLSTPNLLDLVGKGQQSVLGPYIACSVYGSFCVFPESCLCWWDFLDGRFMKANMCFLISFTLARGDVRLYITTTKRSNSTMSASIPSPAGLDSLSKTSFKCGIER